MPRKISSFTSTSTSSIEIPVEVSIRDVTMTINGAPAKAQKFLDIQRLYNPTDNGKYNLKIGDILINLGTKEIHKVLGLSVQEGGEAMVRFSTAKGSKELPIRVIAKDLKLVS